MQVRLFGFRLATGEGISGEELFAEVGKIAAAGKQFKFRNHNRLLFFGEASAPAPEGGKKPPKKSKAADAGNAAENAQPSYYVGMFLTIRDQKKFTELIQKDEGYKIKVREVKGSMADFNFFIINKKTLRGLYQHYHQSCSVNQFCEFLKQVYGEVKEVRIAKELVSAGEEPTDAEERKAKRKFRGSLRPSLLFHRESLRQLLEELGTISTFEFDLVALAIDGGQLSPLSGRVRRETHRVSFRTEVSKQTLVGAISGFVTAKGLRRGKVVGTDADGDPATLRLFNTPESFGEYPYEEVADDDVLDIQDITNSPFLTKMLEAAAKHAALFEAPEV